MLYTGITIVLIVFAILDHSEICELKRRVKKLEEENDKNRIAIMSHGRELSKR